MVAFNKVAFHIAELDRKYYLILVDYMSRLLEIIPIVSLGTELLIKNLKPIFARFGIPQTVKADNNPFNSVEFKEFSRSWSFDIITTSPNYAKSNGLAEKGVDIAKNML